MIQCQYKITTGRVIVLSHEEPSDSYTKRKINRPPTTNSPPPCHNTPKSQQCCQEGEEHLSRGLSSLDLKTLPPGGSTAGQAVACVLIEPEISLILQRWLSFKRRSEYVQLVLFRWTRASSSNSLEAVWRLSWIYHFKFGVPLIQQHGCQLVPSMGQACSYQTEIKWLKADTKQMVQIQTYLWNLQCLSFRP